MQYLSPPMYTSLRINASLTENSDLINELQDIINKEFSKRHPDCTSLPKVFRHNVIHDLLLVKSIKNNVVPNGKFVLVDRKCGMSVLRGADVFVPGVLSTAKSLVEGDSVSVFVDIKNGCLKGMTKFDGEKTFVGNGKALLSRARMFKEGVIHGVAVEMTDPLYLALSLNILPGNKFFAQNLPSVVVGHVLGPSSGDKVLDMCAAPGGKTTHLYSLMKGTGILVAVDRSACKVDKILKNAENLQLDLKNLKVITGDSRKLCSTEGQDNTFFPETFDHVLLDAPCSALGQRPQIVLTPSLAQQKNLSSYPALQKQLFSTAVKLVKVGGTIVYSTCTTTVEENEGLVEWALRIFPCLDLVNQVPHLGNVGRSDITSLTQDQLNCLQYFKPPDPLPLTSDCDWFNAEQNVDMEEIYHLSKQAEQDTIGFFIAKFIKVQK